MEASLQKSSRSYTTPIHKTRGPITLVDGRQDATMHRWELQMMDVWAGVWTIMIPWFPTVSPFLRYGELEQVLSAFMFALPSMLVVAPSGAR